LQTLTSRRTFERLSTATTSGAGGPTDVLGRLQAALGDAYRIERELGGGGMSRVFVAEEVALGRKVVVKVLPPEMGAGVNADRFHREIQLAASLQHPHIVPLLSAGHSDDLVWYTMPLIEGESLRTRLAREGELPVPEVVRLLRDVADALAYAHGHGVVHRDIKPDNVLITGQHAVVTDFGVSKAIAAATGAASLTSVGVALGTPAYMAPEQAAAQPNVDHRADVYALGAMAYEMLTGAPPFAGDATAVLAAHVTRVPEPVTARRGAVPAALAALVMRCLEKKPADRWQTTGELHQQLEVMATPSSGTAPTGAVAVTAGRRSWVPRLIALGAGLLVLGVAITWAVRARRTAGLDPQRVVVAPFENATGDSAFSPLGRLASDWITQGLVQADVPGVVSSATTLGPLAAAGELAGEARLQSLARAARARIVVSGAYYRQGDSLRFQAQISDAATGEVIAALDPVSGPTTRPLEAVGTLRQRVMVALAGRVNPRLATWGAAVSRLPSYDAYLEHAAGIEAYARTEYLAARDHFHRAVALDTTFSLALLWEGLSEWCLTLGGPRVDSIIARLERVRSRMTRYAQLRLDWLEALSAFDFERTYVIQQQAAQASGGADDDMRELALAALRTNRLREGVRILEALDPERGWIRLWVEYWGYLASGLHLLGDYRAELRVYRRGLAAGSHSSFTEHAGLRALAALGRYGELQQALDEAVAGLRDPDSAANYYGVAGTELMYHVRRDSGIAVLRRGIAVLRGWGSAGTDSLEAVRSADIAWLMYVTGDWAGCGAAWAAFKQPWLAGGGPCRPLILAAHRGDRAESERLLAARDSADRGADPYGRAWAMLEHARVAAILGDREAALAYLRRVLPVLGFDWAYHLHWDVDLDSLRDYRPFHELLKPKG
jgi:tetratricopeptide (TPR) repeat protein/TolB-like protein